LPGRSSADGGIEEFPEFRDTARSRRASRSSSSPTNGIGQHGLVPHRGWHVAAEPVAQHRQAERAGLGLGQDPERGQQAQHPVQCRLISLGGVGQRRRSPLASGQQVRDAKLGGEVDGAGDVKPQIMCRIVAAAARSSSVGSAALLIDGPS
jgi:hypothetical protein